mgnify:CR=1 FL=1
MRSWAAKFDGRQVYFLPRHGRGHRLLPHRIESSRQHLCAPFPRGALDHLRDGGRQLAGKIRAARCAPAVAILRPDEPAGGAHFFGGGIAAHITFAEPICAPLRDLLAEVAASLGLRVHNGGTYVNMDGPAFSTRAESELNRRHGFDVIGMTNLPEAKLAREAEIALATMAMITDYDCWKTEEEPVSAQTVIEHLLANAETAKKVLCDGNPAIPRVADWPEHRALDSALITDKKLWPTATAGKLRAILERFD